MRKTRGAQASSTDKLQRLQKELTTCQEFAKALCQRESLKRQMLTHAHNVWTQRKSVADLLHLFPSLNSNGDEELLVDQEPAPRKRKAPAEPRAVSPTAARFAIL
jgi:enhancer of polycomb-like protein